MTEALCSTPISLGLYLIKFSKLDPDCVSYLSETMVNPDVGILDYLKLFGATCLLETPAYVFFAKKRNLSWPKTIWQILFLNLATHPVVSFFFPLLMTRWQSSVGSYLAWAEFFAFLTEGILLIYFFKYKSFWAAGATITANLTSWWLGVYLIEWGVFG